MHEHGESQGSGSGMGQGSPHGIRAPAGDCERLHITGVAHAIVPARRRKALRSMAARLSGSPIALTPQSSQNQELGGMVHLCLRRIHSTL